MLTTPCVSIVIPSHCRIDLLERCLASVRRHLPAGGEIIVVDDGSPGGIVSAAVARRWAGVRRVRLPRRGGFCRAANAGLQAARASVVELLNDDTVVAAGWAEAALRHFADPQVAAVAPLVLQGEPSEKTGGPAPRIDSAGDEYDPGGIARKRGHGQLWDARLPAAWRQAGVVMAASGCAAFYRRERVLELGGFAETFGAYFEDVDLSLRLRAAGDQIIYEPAAVVWHQISASYGQQPRRRLLEMQSCNEERLFLRHWRQFGGWPLWLRHAAVLAGKWLRRLSEGPAVAVPWCFGRLRAWVQPIDRLGPP